MRKLLLILVAAFGVGACASIPAPPEVATANLCDAPRYVLEIDPHDQGFLPGNAGKLSEAFAQSYSALSLSGEGTSISPSMLFLSGGSQHGAFGAGALGEWANLRPDGLPRFRVVTGISTGSIMATHAFLDDTATIVKNYKITREREILRPYVKSSEMKNIRDIITTVRRGAVGDLTPMRSLLSLAIDDDVLRRVAGESGAGRLLLVGTVDVELGKAVIFDMTKLAANYVGEPQAKRREVLRNCYLDIIVASSSVPLAAPPTFIDNRMYIDGGARLGIITDEIGAAANAVAPMLSTQEEGFRPSIYVIVNGDLNLDHECRKANTTHCDDPAGLQGAQRPWSLPHLATRSVSILVDQIYRLSNERIHLYASQNGFSASTLRIDDALETFKANIAFPGESTDGLTCAQWRTRDKQLERPLEFHPRYMRCLIAFGADRLSLKGWACADPVEPNVPQAARLAWEKRCPSRHVAASVEARARASAQDHRGSAESARAPTIDLFEPTT